MSTRALMATITITAVVLFIVVLFAGVAILRWQFMVLLPQNIVPQVLEGILSLLTYQAIGLGIAAIVIAAVAYWLQSTSIAAPLSAIVANMAAFAESGQRQPMPDTSGKPVEMQQLTQVLIASMDKIELSHKKDEEVSRVKSDFISTAAHQLRTPLTGIRWALEALERDAQLSQEQQALVKSAVEKSHDLVAIVGTLLDISAIESGKYNYQFAPMDLGALAQEVANDFTPLAAQSQVSLVFAPSETPLPQINADRDRIKWILNNLIENAIRYTPAGGNVTVSANRGANQVQVRVRDTGIGIPEQERGNIFERFYRAGNAITKENAGNGLGLYIARTIATDHGGDLDFQPNAEGPGTTFILSFPVPA